MNYKKQIEEAEEIGSLNLSKYIINRTNFIKHSFSLGKFRRVEGDLMDTQDRAMLKEQMLAKLRGRASSVGPGRASSLGPQK